MARQYCGSLGKVENCQSGVFVGYSSPKGYGLVNCRLYLREGWFAPEYAAGRQKCGVPEDLTFQAKPAIALQLLAGIRASGRFPARWVYELCSWRGWHRHMLYVFLAMLFLLEVRQAFVKKGLQLTY